MRVLVCGASGFIGRSIAEWLTAAGHTVIRGVRRASDADDVAIDFGRDLSPEVWRPRLVDIDAVVNAVGILVEQAGQTFETVHHRAPAALFEACAQQGVRRVVQISALGAEGGDTGYFRSKRSADEFLMRQSVEWQVVRPALVYGEHGGSARFFRLLASLPAVGLPGRGDQQLQPIHVDDLADLVLHLLDPHTSPRQIVDAVGSTRVTYGGMLQRYRSAMQFPPALEVRVPVPVMAAAALVSAKLPGAILTPDTWRMLNAGNVGDPARTAEILGRSPKGVDEFIGVPEAAGLRRDALAMWLPGLFRGVLAVVWILSALTSIFWYPIDQSLALLQRAGISGRWAEAALIGASALDFALGIATMIRPGRRLWLLQGAVIVVYSLIIAVKLPEFLMHPFGPVLKNLPILAMLVMLWSEEKP